MQATTPTLSPSPSLWATGAIGALALSTMAAYWIALPPASAGPVSTLMAPVANVTATDATPGHAGAVPRMDAAIVSQRAGDGLFYLTAQVNGHPTRFVMDTGASVVVLSPADAASAGISLDGGGVDAPRGDAPGAASSSPMPETHVTTASGAVVMRWVRVGTITLGQKRFHDVPVAIAPGGTVSLVGQSLLSRLGTITMHDDQVEIR